MYACLAERHIICTDGLDFNGCIEGGVVSGIGTDVTQKIVVRSWDFVTWTGSLVFLCNLRISSVTCEITGCCHVSCIGEPVVVMLHRTVDLSVHTCWSKELGFDPSGMRLMFKDIFS